MVVRQSMAAVVIKSMAAVVRESMAAVVMKSITCVSVPVLSVNMYLICKDTEMRPKTEQNHKQGVAKHGFFEG